MAGIASKGIVSQAKTLIGSVFGQNYTAQSKRTRDSFGSGLTVAVTVALQYGLEKGVFSCPQQKHYQYGMIFLLSPMIPLYGLSVISTRELSRSLQGFCASCHFRQKRFIHRTRYVLKTLCVIFTKCILAPITWLTMALMQKNMYACAMVGPTQFIPGTNKTTPEYKRDRAEAEARSQVLGWSLLMAGVTITCIGYISQQCFKKKEIEPETIELEPLDNYPAYEADSARDYFETLMKEAARENGRRKVEVLLGIKPKKLPSTDEGGDESGLVSITYERIMRARDTMLHVYPRLENPLDESLMWYRDEEWKTEARKFKFRISVRENGLLRLAESDNEVDGSFESTDGNFDSIPLREMSTGPKTCDVAVDTSSLRKDFILREKYRSSIYTTVTESDSLLRASPHLELRYPICESESTGTSSSDRKPSLSWSEGEQQKLLAVDSEETLKDADGDISIADKTLMTSVESLEDTITSSEHAPLILSHGHDRHSSSFPTENKESASRPESWSLMGEILADRIKDDTSEDFDCDKLALV